MIMTFSSERPFLELEIIYMPFTLCSSETAKEGCVDTFHGKSYPVQSLQEILYFVENFIANFKYRR